MTHKIKFELGQTVYVKTDPDQLERLVTGITLRPNNQVCYALSFIGSEVWCYEFEISTERDYAKG